jgi:hypothetical protein
MSHSGGTRRGGSTAGLYKLSQDLLPKAPPTLDPPKPKHYLFCEDLLFPGVWRSEPVDYQGRGFVFLFTGQMARWEAMAFTKSWNRRNFGI